MRTIRGDLLQLALDGQFDAIVQGCNCQCHMGKGIALAIKQRFPEAYAADLATAKGDRSKLGTISVAEIRRGEDLPYRQRLHPVSLAWARCEGRLRCHPQRHEGGQNQVSRQRIGYPKLGAGLAGGDWAVIASIIDEELAGENHTLVEFAP